LGEVCGMQRLKASERLYALVADPADARVCRDISADACRVIPGNFFRLIAASALSKAGDQLMNPKTVLAWLIVSVGAPPALVAALVPIRESGSMVPQLAIGAIMRRHAIRKGFWVLGSLLQAASVVLMAVSVWQLSGLAAGVALVVLVACFALSRGLCSVAMKDVQGKCVPKSRRGRLGGLADTLAGVAALAVGIWLLRGAGHPDARFYTALLLGAGACWVAAAGVFHRVREFAGETAEAARTAAQAWRSLGLLRHDPHFRRVVATRALLMASALASPFIVVLARGETAGVALLGGFVVASSLAASLSASVWGFMADHSSRRVMLLAGALAAGVCLATGALALAGPRGPARVWWYPVAFFALAVAHAGGRIGRKTYLIDMAAGNRRTDYVAVSNTVIGVLLLVAGALSAAVATLGTAWALVALGTMAALGATWAWRLPEVDATAG
jgi:hypothetical protein